jgi:hypothetical protein
MLLKIIIMSHTAAFEVNPKDSHAKRNDNVELRCQPSSINDFIIWEIFLDNGTYWTVSGSDAAQQLRRLVHSSKRSYNIILSAIVIRVFSLFFQRFWVCTYLWDVKNSQSTELSCWKLSLPSNEVYRWSVHLLQRQCHTHNSRYIFKQSFQ